MEQTFLIFLNDKRDTISILKGSNKEIENFIEYPKEKIPFGKKAALISALPTEVKVKLFDTEKEAYRAMESELDREILSANDVEDLFLSESTAHLHFTKRASIVWRIVQEEDFCSEPISVMLIHYKDASGFTSIRFGKRKAAKEALINMLKEKNGTVAVIGETFALGKFDDDDYIAGTGKDLFTDEQMLVYVSEGIKYKCFPADESPELWLVNNIGHAPCGIYTRKKLFNDSLMTV